MEFLLGFITFLIGYWCEGHIAYRFNIPGIGFFIGIVIMNTVIFWYIRHRVKPRDEDSDE